MLKSEGSTRFLVFAFCVLARKAVRGADVSIARRGCTSAAPSRRLPRPHSSRPHGHDPPACGREVGGRLAQGTRPVRLHPCVRRRHWAPANEFMTWRWSIDLLSLLALPAAPRRSTSWRELMDVSCWVCRYTVQHRCSGAAHRTIAPEPSELRLPSLSRPAV